MWDEVTDFIPDSASVHLKRQRWKDYCKKLSCCCDSRSYCERRTV